MHLHRRRPRRPFDLLRRGDDVLLLLPFVLFIS